MSGYNRKEKTFTLTATKLEHYHRHHRHDTLPREICPICHYQYGKEYMEIVATFLTANGFEVVDIGDVHITINTPSKPYKKFGMWVTKESDALYQLLAGRTDPQPGSLPSDSSDLDPYAAALSKNDEFSPQQANPLNQLHAWLNDLKAQIYIELQQAELQYDHLKTIQEDSLEDNDQGPFEQSRHTVIIQQAKLSVIDQIQAKIEDLLKIYPR
jgi:hypothetical protein